MHRNLKSWNKFEGTDHLWSATKLWKLQGQRRLKLSDQGIWGISRIKKVSSSFIKSSSPWWINVFSGRQLNNPHKFYTQKMLLSLKTPLNILSAERGLPIHFLLKIFQFKYDIQEELQPLVREDEKIILFWFLSEISTMLSSFAARHLIFLLLTDPLRAMMQFLFICYSSDELLLTSVFFSLYNSKSGA